LWEKTRRNSTGKHEKEILNSVEENGEGLEKNRRE